MSESADSARLDALWNDLAPHVEWPEGFSLVVLFAGHPGPVGELRGRLEESVRERGKTLARIDPAREDDVRGLLPQILATPEPGCGALWISLLRGGGDPAWTAAVRWLLQRLNERRFLLERDVGAPVVVVLPLELRSEVYALAPDLWSVRAFSEVVPEPEAVAVAVVAASRVIDNRGASIGQQIVVDGNATFGPMEVRIDTRRRAELEWARLLATGDLRRVAAADGFAAYDAAVERGDLGAARRIAMATLAVVLSRGVVEVERSDDFALTQMLNHADLPDARTQRDLSVTLNMLGNVEVHAGSFAAARSHFQRSLAIAEALAEADPRNAQAQHDLCVSLTNLGHVETQAGNLTAARCLFERAYDILSALVAADPHNVSMLGDVSAALKNLGNIEVQTGELAAARSHFQHSLTVAEALVEADPHNAQTRRNLLVSLNNLGNLEALASDLAAARSHFQRSLSIAEELALADPENAPAAFDVVKSHEFLAWLARKSGDRTIELDHLRRAHTILTAMDTKGQIRGYAEREQLLADITHRLS